MYAAGCLVVFLIAPVPPRSKFIKGFITGPAVVNACAPLILAVRPIPSVARPSLVL